MFLLSLNVSLIILLRTVFFSAGNWYLLTIHQQTIRAGNTRMSPVYDKAIMASKEAFIFKDFINFANPSPNGKFTAVNHVINNIMTIDFDINDVVKF